MTTTVTALPKKLCGNFAKIPMVALLSTGELVGWGDNTTGALANGTPTSATYAGLQRVVFDPNTTIPPSNATIVDWAFTAGNLYVVYSNGWVYSAGANDYGQLGQGDTTMRPWLKRIEYFVTNNLSINKVWAAASKDGTNNGGCVYFQASTNAMYACGMNTQGNLGNASTPTSNVSTPAICSGVGTSPHVVDVQISTLSALFSAYMIMSDGTILVAGYNAFGQLATGNTTNVTGSFVNAKKTGGTNVTTCASLSVTKGGDSGQSALMLDTSANVWAVGINTYGELGIGNTTAQSLFTQVTALSNIVTVDIGGEYQYAYAINSTGTFYTWGYNAANNLFLNNSTSPKTTPTVAADYPGTISKIFFPRSENILANAQMIMLTTSGLLAYAGTANGQTGIANIAIPGAYYLIPTPLQFLNGAESIVDVFIHGTATSQRWFILSNLGNLYATGSNVGSVCTGGLSSNSMAANVSWYKIDNF